jgi:hypothetical protein
MTFGVPAHLSLPDIANVGPSAQYAAGASPLHFVVPDARLKTPHVNAFSTDFFGLSFLRVARFSVD